MRMEELKRGFWGYQKESVYRCIASMEEEFSRRLLEKDEKASRAEEQFQARIAELAAELKAAREACEEQRRSHTSISDTLLKAQAYGQQLREETFHQEEETRRDIQRTAERQRAELAAYQEKLERLRGMFRTLLDELDGKAAMLEQQLKAAGDAAPQPTMSLFQRKPEGEPEQPEEPERGHPEPSDGTEQPEQEERESGSWKTV